MIFIISLYLKGLIHNEIIWRIIDILSYNILPISIITLFFKLKQTKENYNFIVISLTVYLLVVLGVHWDLMKCLIIGTSDSKFESLITLNSINSLVFYLWSVSLVASLILIIVLINKNKKTDSNDYLKNRLFIMTILLVYVLYFLDHGFFDPHGGWTGWHGHSFWESSGHLH